MPLKPLLALLLLATIAPAQAVHMVPVDRNVQLEVLDWGGTGEPLVLLTGLDNTAHIFDDFAPKLSRYHVYAITRRGFGISSAPAAGYTADRLADDVLAVLDALAIVKPVVAGHSIAGEELSSIATRHPERVKGLIYLDAALSFAFYDPTLGDMNIDSLTLQRRLQELSTQPPQPLPIVHELLDTDLPAYTRDLHEFERRMAEHPPTPTHPHHDPTAADRATFAAYRNWQGRTENMLFPESELRQQFTANSDGSVGAWRDHSEGVRAIVNGEQKFTSLGSVPMMAIFAMDPGHGKEEQSAAFEKANPTAPVVRIKDANHYVFLSNEAEVIRAIDDFITVLPDGRPSRAAITP
jgi:non-heme chloroperoxidase